MSDRRNANDVAVLVSGGIDSAVLTVELSRLYRRIIPIYVRFGLRWEHAEFAALRGFLGQIQRPGLSPLVVLEEPVSAVYDDHWSLGGSSVPDSESPDEAVYLPGRNLLLISKAAVYCQIRGIESLAIGTLSGNPFPDAKSGFFDSLRSTLNHGLHGRFNLIRPFERLTKVEVMRRGAGLPLAMTFSCLDPVAGQHCGACNKCSERQRAFTAAGMDDPTLYRVQCAMADRHKSRDSPCIG